MIAIENSEINNEKKKMGRPKKYQNKEEFKEFYSEYRRNEQKRNHMYGKLYKYSSDPINGFEKLLELYGYEIDKSELNNIKNKIRKREEEKIENSNSDSSLEGKIENDNSDNSLEDSNKKTEKIALLISKLEKSTKYKKIISEILK